MVSYSDKLKDPRWQRKRLEILNRDNWTCVYCQEKEDTLHVHHEMYFEGDDPWECPDEGLNTVCQDCHSLFHSKLTKLERYLLDKIKFKYMSQGCGTGFNFLKSEIRSIMEGRGRG